MTTSIKILNEEGVLKEKQLMWFINVRFIRTKID